MKRIVTILAAMLLSTGLWAQSPAKMSYQAVIRNAGDELVVSQAIGLKISIIKGSVDGSPVYVETQAPTTNLNGLISIEIGEGTVVSGSFSAIDWSKGPMFIKSEVDPSGGTTYTISGASQLLSVPYALYAKEVENKEDAIWTQTDTSVYVLDKDLGIGLALPLSELDVKGALRSSAGKNRYMSFDGQHPDGNAYINYRTTSRSGLIGFQMNGVDRMIINSAGNVGIGTTKPTARLEVNGNLLVKGDIKFDGLMTGEISIDSIHVSKITGLLGEGYTVRFPDVMNNYVELQISGVILTENVVMVSSLGHETERISTPWKISTKGDTSFREAPGLTMELPIAFETGNTVDINTLKDWFDNSPEARTGSVVIKDLSGAETDRWNYYDYIPDSYEKAEDGRMRFKLKYRDKPDNIVRCKYETGDFGGEHSYNPITDKLFEMSGITHAGFTPEVKVDYRKRTITLTVDYPEGAGLKDWSYQTAAGKDSPRSGSIIETTDGTSNTEISRRNFFECIPIRYEVFYGFGQNIKLKARIVIAFGFWEEA